MGLTLKTLEDLGRVVAETIKHHKEQFGTSLTKKEMKATVEKALAEKRKKWLEGRITDHSISELQTLLKAVDEHKVEKSLVRKILDGE